MSFIFSANFESERNNYNRDHFGHYNHNMKGSHLTRDLATTPWYLGFILKKRYLPKQMLLLKQKVHNSCFRVHSERLDQSLKWSVNVQWIKESMRVFEAELTVSCQTNLMWYLQHQSVSSSMLFLPNLVLVNICMMILHYIMMALSAIFQPRVLSAIWLLCSGETYSLCRISWNVKRLNTYSATHRHVEVEDMLTHSSLTDKYQLATAFLTTLAFHPKLRI